MHFPAYVSGAGPLKILAGGPLPALCPISSERRASHISPHRRSSLYPADRFPASPPYPFGLGACGLNAAYCGSHGPTIASHFAACLYSTPPPPEQRLQPPRPIIAVSRLQSFDCFGLFRRMTAKLNFGQSPAECQKMHLAGFPGHSPQACRKDQESSTAYGYGELLTFVLLVTRRSAAPRSEFRPADHRRTG
jgi:hypothetical protein